MPTSQTNRSPRYCPIPRERLRAMFSRRINSTLSDHTAPDDDQAGCSKAASKAILDGLKAILLLDDVGFPSAFDTLDELKSQTGDVPISVFAEFDQFVGRLGRHTLPGGVLYQVTGVPDTKSANRCMEKVRRYRV